MYLKNVLLFSLFVISSSFTFSQNEKKVIASTGLNEQFYQINDTVGYFYSRPKPFSYIKNAWKDMYEVPKSVWKKESIKPAAFVVLSTGVLIAFDDKIYEGVRKFSDHIGLAETNNTVNISPIDGLALNLPTDLSSGLYYIGDGITELGVNAGFYIYGLAKNDYRALRVANQLSEGMIAVGIYVQVMKHLTMHETPERRSMPEYPRGRWKFFNVTDPIGSIKEYHSSVPSNDAYPSGHLSIAMMATTVIALNYPEKRWIKPVCYSLMGLCGYQMINNGVHWISDYPLAFAMGYSFGKVIVNRERRKASNNEMKNHVLSCYPKKIDGTWKMGLTKIYPGIGGLSLSYNF
ncbi:MAG: phosphatase PAP2 family protein [Marinilabiliaceae bacterium]|nr:phosphatase PAP2 family protein [Marinilabiliaceae bacterium]